jgi:hypothetical protein
MVFDEAVATTFSMDPAMLLEAPVYLALMAADGHTEPDPLSILEAIRRYSKKISVYVQKGRIQVPQVVKANPLFGLLEQMVVEVKAPGGGVFHPKIWAIRFVTPDRSRSMIRLVVLTRNMTNDHSWDLSLQLEGSIGTSDHNENEPLAYFFKELPGMASIEVETEMRDQANRFSADIARAEWQLPDGFDSLEFFLPSIEKYQWIPPESNRLTIISPFCSDEILKRMVKKTKSAAALISRPEALVKLNKETRDLFSQCLHLDDAAETEEGEEENPSERPLATGLHAKVYLLETFHYVEYTHVVVGSANATNAALKTGKNVEILVGLKGKTSKVGGIDELLGEDGLGEYLVTFNADKEAQIDMERQQAEEYIESARTLLSDADLSIICRNGARDNLWILTLDGRIPFLEGIVRVKVWPITVMDDYAVEISSNDTEHVRLGEFSSSSVTGLLAFELKTGHPDVSTRFVLNLPVDGLPGDRNSAILQTVISNQDGFIRYLLLLLGEDPSSGILSSGQGAGPSLWLARLAAGEDVPLLEELTRAYSRYPDRLNEVSGLVRELSREGKEAVIPENFLKLWSVFESAMGGSDE